MNTLHGYAVTASDGKIGKVHDFYFEDDFWILRYLVVDLGHWLPGRKVLIASGALGSPDWASRSFPVTLTREQVERSPDIDTDKPVSRQQEILLHRHYNWLPYWMVGDIGPRPQPIVVDPLPTAEEPFEAERKQTGDPHLRSVNEVTGYHIHASDGSIGHIEDFIADDSTWDVRYLVVATHNWVPGRKVLISPQWLVGRISWAEKTVNVIMTKESIRNSPPFDPAAPINREYENRLYDYYDFYGRPGYWVKSEEQTRRT